MWKFFHGTSTVRASAPSCLWALAKMGKAIWGRIRDSRAGHPSPRVSLAGGGQAAVTEVGSAVEGPLKAQTPLPPQGSRQTSGWTTWGNCFLGGKLSGRVAGRCYS